MELEQIGPKWWCSKDDSLQIYEGILEEDREDGYYIDGIKNMYGVHFFIPIYEGLWDFERKYRGQEMRLTVDRNNGKITLEVIKDE